MPGAKDPSYRRQYQCDSTSLASGAIGPTVREAQAHVPCEGAAVGRPFNGGSHCATTAQAPAAAAAATAAAVAAATCGLYDEDGMGQEDAQARQVAAACGTARAVDIRCCCALIFRSNIDLALALLDRIDRAWS